MPDVNRGDNEAFDDLKAEFLEEFNEHTVTELEMFSDALERRGHAALPDPEHGWEGLDLTLYRLIALLDEAGEEEELMQYSSARYLGEVVRHRFGGEWSCVELNENGVPEPMLVGHEMESKVPFNPFAALACLRVSKEGSDIRSFIEQRLKR
ncbi:hypothetical protein ACMGRF_11635 [Stenotrophomonas sp. EMP41]|uniref:hypothetical protein n=1 Tax=Stenotrophomonas TaxID=40323 RepID=UPI000C14A192|nr:MULTISPECIES: hypothetical protein [Stenotrophomonas maltophilia group]